MTAPTLTPEFAAKSDRRGELVSRKFSGGLTDAEAAELAEIGVWMNEFWRPFYAPVIEELKSLVEERRPPRRERNRRHDP